MINAVTREKYKLLIQELSKYNKLAVAFSGGVDSSLLAATAINIPNVSVVGLIVNSVLIGKKDLESAKDIATEIGLDLRMLKFDPLSISGLSTNEKNRCYICKKALIKVMRTYLEENKMSDYILIDGLNTSDSSEFRPGIVATNESNVLHPYQTVNIGKSDIREIAENIGASFAHKPSNPCLASRVPYGDLLSAKRLIMIDEGETFIKSLGFNICRIRLHNTVARIEVPIKDFEKLMEHRTEIIAKMKKLGFNYLALDLDGFRSGSMDEIEIPYRL